jgi:hypothetical protein
VSQPRFQILSMSRWTETSRTLPATRGLRSREHRGLVFGWRLLGANNREIARGVEQFLSVEECEREVDDLKTENPEHLVARVSFDPATHGWTWILRSSRGEVAKSARSFHRQRECMYSLTQFKEKFADAVVHLPKQAGGTSDVRKGTPMFVRVQGGESQ